MLKSAVKYKILSDFYQEMLVAGLLKIKKFNFQGFTMSQSPQKLPKRTRVLVKDILFQEKYKLSHTQVDIMAYIINASMWAVRVGSFFPITNKKFHTDLPQIGEKTLEEALRELKSMELIEVQMITVPQWNNARVRGIQVLPKGLEYNSYFSQMGENEIISHLKHLNMELMAQLKEKDNIIKTEKITENETQAEEKVTKKESKDDKIIEDAIEDKNKYSDLGFTEFVKTVTKEFGQTSQPICNGVKGWKKETLFYINSYNKLTIVNQSGEAVQLKNPVEISNFWKYLYENRDKIGQVRDFSKETLTIDELNSRYAKMDIILNGTIFQIDKITKFKDGVKVSIKNMTNGDIVVISRDGEAVSFGLQECEDVILGLRE